MVATTAFTTGDGITLENLRRFAGWAIERAQTAMDTMAPAVRLALPRLEVSLYTQNTGYAELARQRLSQAGAGTDRGEPCRILVTSPGIDGMMAPPGWGDELFHSRRFEEALSGTAFRAEFDHGLRFWQIFDIRRNIGVQWMQSERAYPPWEPGSPLRVFLHWFYSARGMRLAHAGTLGKNGKGVLLVGRGGSGKSGSVVDGVLAGLQTVGDDYVLLDHGGGFPMAFPVFRTFKQDAGGLRRLGLYDAIRAGREPNWQGKYEFFSEDIDGVAMTPSLEIRALLVPHLVEQQHSELSAVSRARAMLALAPSGLFQMPGERDSGVTRFAELVRSLPCFGLSLGHDRAALSQVIGDFLDGVA
ncbi:serine kinase [Mesorhizobium sp. M0761]|uniref:serine kinase n=1 Tax=Mesorhizobium sp. M0761 TaxID=2956994 RepID=UPI003337B7ED